MPPAQHLPSRQAAEVIMAHLPVIGASGGIGLAVVKAGIAAEPRVRGLSRRADAIRIDDPAFEPAPGDATDRDTVAAAPDGIDAVIFALGVPEEPAAHAAPRDDLFWGPRGPPSPRWRRPARAASWPSPALARARAGRR